MGAVASRGKEILKAAKNTYQRTVNPQKPLPELHALIIGINQYEKISQLSGAVADADSIEDYLKRDLSVPPSHIINLRDQEASRSGIIRAFQELRDHPDLKPLDPILIYYAGHGCELEAPSGLKCSSADSKVQCIIPQDVRKVDDNGDTVCPIPDYTLAALLYDLAESKGNNIVGDTAPDPELKLIFKFLETVIFDSCHSASSTRGAFSVYTIPLGGLSTFPTLGSTNHRRISMPPPPQLQQPVVYGNDRARYTAPFTLPSIHSFLDRDILRHRTSKAKAPSSTNQQYSPQVADSATQSIGEGMRSHVLLAACGHAEQAFERYTNKSGYFTSALLRILRSKKIDKLTYKACMTSSFPRLETPRPQNPVCEGEHVNRFFFNALVPGAHSSFIPITSVKKDIVLQAGPAQGIFPGDTFSIHAEDVIESQNPSLGTFVVEPYGYKSSMSLCRLDREQFRSIEVPSVAYGRLAAPKIRSELGVYFSESFSKEFSSKTAQTVKLGKGQSKVETLNKARVALDIDQPTGKVTFELVDELANFYGLNALPYTILPNASSIEHVLFSMTQWNWHVTRTPKRRRFKEQLHLEFYRLQEDDSGPESSSLEPVGENLNRDGVAKITASSKDLYGFKVVNNTGRQLYAYLFWFSTINQAIRPLSLKVYGSAEIDVPLPAGAELTLGYGNDDLAPLSFQLIEKARVDIGVFRLFVTTAPADFDCMAQPSPFSALQSVSPAEDQFVDGISDVTGAAHRPVVETELQPGLSGQDSQVNSNIPEGQGKSNINDHHTSLAAGAGVVPKTSGPNPALAASQPGADHGKPNPQLRAYSSVLDYTTSGPETSGERPSGPMGASENSQSNPEHPLFPDPTTHTSISPAAVPLEFSAPNDPSTPANPLSALPPWAYSLAANPHSKHLVPTFSARVVPTPSLSAAMLPLHSLPAVIPSFHAITTSEGSISAIPALVFPEPRLPEHPTTSAPMPTHPNPGFPALVVQVSDLPKNALPAPAFLAAAPAKPGHSINEYPTSSSLMPGKPAPENTESVVPASKLQQPAYHANPASPTRPPVPQVDSGRLPRRDHAPNTVRSRLQDVWDVVDLKIVIQAST